MKGPVLAGVTHPSERSTPSLSSLAPSLAFPCGRERDRGAKDGVPLSQSLFLSLSVGAINDGSGQAPGCPDISTRLPLPTFLRPLLLLLLFLLLHLLEDEIPSLTRGLLSSANGGIIGSRTLVVLVVGMISWTRCGHEIPREGWLRPVAAASSSMTAATIHVCVCVRLWQRSIEMYTRNGRMPSCACWCGCSVGRTREAFGLVGWLVGREGGKSCTIGDGWERGVGRRVDGWASLSWSKDNLAGGWATEAILFSTSGDSFLHQVASCFHDTLCNGRWKGGGGDNDDYWYKEGHCYFQRTAGGGRRRFFFFSRALPSL